MKNKASATTRAGVAIAAAIFAFGMASVSAADLNVKGNSAVEFQAIAGSDLLVLGPVDAVDLSKDRAQILGQWIPLSGGQSSPSLVGHVLAVYGSVTADGTYDVSAVREQSSVDYVPGATHLYLKAPISAIDTVHATARVGVLSVSYSNALHSLAAEDLAVERWFRSVGCSLPNPTNCMQIMVWYITLQMLCRRSARPAVDSKLGVKRAAASRPLVKQAVDFKLGVKRAAASRPLVKQAVDFKLGVKRAAASRPLVKQAVDFKLGVKRAAASRPLVKQAVDFKLGVKRAAASRPLVKQAVDFKLGVKRAAASRLLVKRAVDSKLGVKQVAASRPLVKRAVDSRLGVKQVAV